MKDIERYKKYTYELKIFCETFKVEYEIRNKIRRDKWLNMPYSPNVIKIWDDFSRKINGMLCNPSLGMAIKPKRTLKYKLQHIGDAFSYLWFRITEIFVR